MTFTLVVWLVPAIVQAQAPASNVAPVAATPTAPAPAATNAAQEAKARLRFGADYQLASWLLAEQEKSQAVAKLVLDRAERADVKKFAQRSLDEGAELAKRLRPFADLQEETEQATEKLLAAPAATVPNAGQTANEPPRVTVDVAAGNAAVPVATEAAPSVAGGGDAGAGTVIIAKMTGSGFDLVSLKRKLAQRESAAAQKWLGEASGPELQYRYLTLENDAQAGMLVTLKVFRQHASPKLQAVLESLPEKVQSRLDEGRKLADQFRPGRS
ncbi:MAG: hypothetical protein C0483_01340 [Pirellula sp.]|nr:hypothetical protein [Pirellula sp.]